MNQKVQNPKTQTTTTTTMPLKASTQGTPPKKMVRISTDVTVVITYPDAVLLVAAVQEPYANIKIGASRKTCTFRQLEIDKKDDRAFDQLRTKLGQHITAFRSTLCNVRPDDDVSQLNAIVCVPTDY
jgi:hypothetical protein